MGMGGQWSNCTNHGHGKPRAEPDPGKLTCRNKHEAKITTNNRLQKHHKSLKNALRHSPRKIPRGLCCLLDDTEPQQVTLPPPSCLGHRAGRREAAAHIRASPYIRSNGRLCPHSTGCGFTRVGTVQAVLEQGCGTRGAAWGLWSTSASRLAPTASPPVHLVCVFLQSTLPAGYVRGEECRATLCHEIRLTFLG